MARAAAAGVASVNNSAAAPSGTAGINVPPGTPNTLTFHGDNTRSGFNQNETTLNPTNVSTGFGQVWQSPALDGRLYATPLYVDSLTISGNGNAANHAGDGVLSSSFQNKTLGVVFAATGGGSVYAIATGDTAGATGIAPGTILWKTHLGNAYAGVDGNSIGVLGTPVIDLTAKRIYVVASVTDYLSPASNPLHGANTFAIFALNLSDGSLISGWPVFFTQAGLNAVNQNRLNPANPTVLFSESGADQRGSLLLSPDGKTVWVDWACYGASNPGWMTTVATGITNGQPNGQTPAVTSAYAAADISTAVANGGMWGAGGPSMDAGGNVFVSTGDSPANTGNPAGVFGNSVMEFALDANGKIQLTGLYSPWNYQNQDTIDSDLGGGSPILINLPAGSSTTTELLATGGKQGNGYLLNAGNHLNNPTARPGSPASFPADLTARPPGTVTPSQDPGLYDTSAAGIRSYFSPAQVGPLALFGPYNETSASGNTAKARDTPATFTAPDGSQYVIWAGASKASVGSSTPVAPSLYTTKIIHSAGQPAYLQISAADTAVMSNPGAGMITADGTGNEVYWILDAGVQRTDSLANFSNGAPTLYAYDPVTMRMLWSSSFEELDMGGKYNSVTAARGDVFVGTDRIQAYGLTGNTLVDDSVTGAAASQFNYTGAGWQHVTGSTTMGTYDGTVSTDNVQGDFATLTFTGSAIKVYANEKSGYGTATFSVDGASVQSMLLSPSTSSPNGLGSGDVPVYTVSGLGAGQHTLKILNNAASNTISVDKVEIVPPTSTHSQLGVSMTDGNVLASLTAPIQYTVNYNNAGSAVSNVGVAASGVVLDDTVPANTAFDAADSTPGWALVSAGPSGAGSAGSVYRYTVGSLGAGASGSTVFAVNLNSSIPPGTTTVTNQVTIRDTAGDAVSASRATPIPPAAEAKLIFSQQPPANASAGIALSPPVTVTAQDQFGNTYTPDSSSTVTLTLNGGTFSNGQTTATATVVNGVATFNSLIISAAGNYTLTATDGQLTPTTSAPFTVAATAKLGVLQQPTQTVAGQVISPAVKVGVEDQGGNVITSDTSTVILQINHGSFANGSTTATAQAVNGVATFNNLAINASGSYTLTAIDGTLQQAQSNSFNVVATASKVVFTQQPNNTYAGEAINPAVTVALEDGFGNVDAANATPVTVTLNGGGATFFGGATTATVTPVNGVATFGNLVVTNPGTFTLTAAAAGLTGATSFPFTIGSHSLTSIDDNNANNVGGTPQVVYSSPTTRWVQTPTSSPNNYDGTVTTDSTGGDTATVTFNGTLITLYALQSPTAGNLEVFIDGGNPAEISLASSTTGVAPVFTSPLLSAGTHTVVVKVVSGNVAIDRFVVGPATPTLAWATPADLTFGTALDGTELDAFVTNFASFPGTFTYSPAAGIVLPVGQNQPLRVTFTPQDSANYDSATATVLINVTKATPVLTWTGPGTNLTYGQALGPSTLNAVATLNGVQVPGTYTYTPSAGTVPPTGDNFELHVDFVPNDTADYNSVSLDSDVDVDPATPVVTWNNPADIVDGTPLGAAQLNATANVPGTFTYSPAAGTVLPVGQRQQLGVVFHPTDDTNYNIVATTALINVIYGPAAKLAFTQQPTSVKAGVAISPAVQVAVQDSAGTTLPADGSTVTLTLNGGKFSNGQTTATAAAVNGVATFSGLTINTSGTYTLTATDGSLPANTSNAFTVGNTVYVDFNHGVTDFTSIFALNDQGAASTTPRMIYSATGGIADGDAGSKQGGVLSQTGAAIDETAVFTPTTFDLSDHAVHTVSEYVTAAGGIGSGDRLLQVGFVTARGAGFNGGFSFISARVYGDYSAEFQSGNGSGTAAVSTNHTAAHTITAGDWLQLIFTTQETASGSFQGTFSLLDFGASGTAAVPSTVIAPVAYSVTGLTTVGTATAMFPGFRTATTGSFTSPIAFDNFAVDQAPAKLAYVQQPAGAKAGQALGSFVVGVEDLAGHVVAGDTSTVTVILNHGTFSDGTTTKTTQAIHGLATFANLTVNDPGGYILRATDSNPNLDPGFAPFAIQGTPTITWPSPAPIVWGTKFGSGQLNATATFNGQPVAGTFTYTPAAGTVLNVGNNQAVGVTFTPSDPASYSSVNGATTINVVNSTVAARKVFYNNSYFDGNDPAANDADDAAIATDKQALLPGQTATFANYTSYSKGLNGILIDVSKLPNGGADLSAADFTFKAGTSTDVTRWAAAPAPVNIVVRQGRGTGGGDRVELIWADGMILNQWLQVSLLANTHTGLAANDTFYFGNAVGESGNSATDTFVDGSDFAGARDDPHNFLSRADVTNVHDYNRDSFVDGTDLAIARDDTTNFLTSLKLITAPAAT